MGAVVRGEFKDKGVAKRRRFLIARVTRLDVAEESATVHWHYPQDPKDLSKSKWLPVVDAGKPHTDTIVVETIGTVFAWSSESRLPDDVISFLSEHGLI
jgi:hypothetical protein